jgi:RNA polymerase sigma factor (sigma-70 family)
MLARKTQPRHLAPRSRVIDDERTDAALLAAAARGDDTAFAVLVRRYIRAATLLAAQFLGDRVEAEDIAQDAFVIVHKKARMFDPNRPFAPWLFAIVRRLAAKRRSRDLRRTRLLRLWAKPGGSEPTASRVEMALIAGFDAEAARRAMKTLSSMQRACFELVAVRGLSTVEVAAMHGISESTVRQHVFRARTALRRILERQNRGQS